MKKIVTVTLGLILATGVFATENKRNKESKNEAAKVETISVSGIVLDNVTGEPIAGAEIKVEGTNVSTYTDINGKYEFNVANVDAKINISFISYKDSQIELSTLRSNNNSIKLTEE